MSLSTPIYTLTGNLLAERTLEYETWEIGKTERATRESFNTRGKGVNVSNMLARLGTDSTALIFAGGPSGAESEAWLRHRGITYRNFETKQAARTGTVIWSDQQAETTFLGPNATPDPDAINACAHFLRNLPDGQVLALCGSFPGWEESDYRPLRAEIERWARRGFLYVDAYGPPLQDIVSLPIELIKINRQEFDAFYTEEERTQSVESRLRTACEKWDVKKLGHLQRSRFSVDDFKQRRPDRIHSSENQRSIAHRFRRRAFRGDPTRITHPAITARPSGRSGFALRLCECSSPRRR